MTELVLTPDMSNEKRPSPSKDRLVRKMGFAILFGLGGFLLWAGFAPLEEGVAASGKIIAEGDRQVIEHLEGGIVKQILVRDGQKVKKGDTLIVLQKTAPLASRDLIVQEYAALAASVERMQALQNKKTELNFAALDELNLGDQERLDIMNRELELFDQQRGARAADVDVLKARMGAAIKTRNARSQQIRIAQKALASAAEELKIIESMFDQQLATRDQKTASERLNASLEADVARLQSERQEASSSAHDFRAQISQTRARSSRDNGKDLLEASAALLAAEERLGAAQDVLDRAVIIAPVAGEIINTQFSTIGGVVQSGETIMEIVPEIADVTAAIRIRPNDRPAIFEGQIVRTQLSSYKGWQAPRLEGTIVGVSADLKTDPATSAVYYEARVRVSAEEMKRAQDVNIIPGMPVDVFVFSGISRTLLDYLFEPIGQSLFRGLRSS